MTISTLGFRSEFSLGESTLSPKAIVEIAERLGQKYVALADTMCMSAMIELTKKATPKGIEALVGCRLRIVPDAAARDKKSNHEAYYIKAWPKNEAGLRQIFALVSRGFQADHFYMVPRLEIADVFAVLKPADVLITTGDVHGVFGHPDSLTIVGSLHAFGFEVMVELLSVPTPYFERINLYAMDAINAYGLDAYASLPTLFDADGYEAFFVNMAIHNRTVLYKSFTINDPWFKDFGPHAPEELAKLSAQTIQGMRIADAASKTSGIWLDALKNGPQRFVDAVGYRWTKGAIALPSLAADPVKAVLDACKRGLGERLGKTVFGYKPTVVDVREKYIPRLTYELGVLEALGFSDYFLVTADLCQWAKGNGVWMGPGRGSVGGSLVAYLMGITDVDPIRFDLLFERFINPSRRDLPDADLDFMSRRREDVITYLTNKYGETHVAGISNYGQQGSASSVNSVARIHGMNANDITATKLVPKVHGVPVSLEEAFDQVGEIQRFAAAEPKIWKQALMMQGVMNIYGLHAAGVIISGVPLTDRAIVERKGEARKVNWDGHVVEDQGLVKMDILGLTTLDILALAVANVQKRTGEVVDLSSIPLDDVDCLKAFSEGKTVGIFQLEGGAARRILKGMAEGSMLTFNDIVATNALNRPGPIEAGLVQDYIDSRNGNKFIGLPHPNMANALKDTHNVIVYQEAVMRISVDLCGFSLADADILRKIMGKKLPEEMAKMRGQFVDGAVSHSSMNRAAADELFDQIALFAGYAFNKSHSAAYSLIGYQAMWMKVKYPIEFYAAAMSTADDKKLPVLVADATANGITVCPPDVNISEDVYVIVDDTTIYAPLNATKGVSAKTAQAIMEARRVPATGQTQPFTSIKEFTDRISGRLCNSKQRENLDTVGAFASIEAGQKKATDVERLKDQMNLLPGVMTGYVRADRRIPTDKFTIAYLRRIVDDMESVNKNADGSFKPQREQTIFVRPTMGDRAKFMCVTDAPFRSEEMAQQFAEGEQFGITAAALVTTDQSRRDCYWTALLKKRKSGKILTAQEIRDHSPFLDREVELLKPPLIVTLGSNAARYFIPDLKGPIDEYVGRTFWDSKRDATILIGFNPMIVTMDPDRFDELAEVFELARMIVSTS